jgi:hypothetical protein
MVKLLFFDTRSPVLSAWRELFAGTEHIVASTRERDAAVTRADGDAMAMPAVVAHERYGGSPIVGRSQVLDGGADGKRDGHNPRWIVTTVPFPAELQLVSENGEMSWKIVQTHKLSRWRETYLTFRGMLRAVEDFNEVYDYKHISTITIDLEYIGMSNEYAADEASSARIAATNYRQDADNMLPGEEIRYHRQTTVEEEPASGFADSLLEAGEIPSRTREIYVSSRARSKLQLLGVPLGTVLDAVMTGKFSRVIETRFDHIEVALSLGSKEVVIIATLSPIRRRFSLRDVYAR